MKADLAESILKNVMNWKDVGIAAGELQDIQIIAETKYDDYQQYTHGMRFVENLALWLRNFETQYEREIAYNFIKENLVFISAEEMHQIVSVTFEIYIKPILLKKTKEFCIGNKINLVEERKKVYKYFRRKTLFLGLSDGAHMDYFRRQNSDLSNEQVFVHYDFSNEKAADMLKELREDSEILSVEDCYNLEQRGSFLSFFLIDDFSASGKSYIRKEYNEWKGKIVKFFERLESTSYNTEKIDVHVILYTATNRAIEYIRNQIENFKKEKSISAKIDIQIVQTIEPFELSEDDKEFQILKCEYEKHVASGDKSYVDSHFMKGDCNSPPFLGFGGCSLPLILYHNTPNNSFPTLWYSWPESTALFPRVTRHKEV